MDEMTMELKKIMEELFTDCIENDGLYRAVAEHVGVVDTNAVIEAMVDTGPQEHPYPSVQLMATLMQNIDAEAVPNLIISLNVLNHVVGTGPFPAFGSFVYYAPLNQVYLSARLPFNPEAVQEDLVNIRYFFGTVYEEIDLFVDFLFMAVSSDNPLSIADYLDYLDMISSLNDIKERQKLLSEKLEEISQRNMSTESNS